MLYLFINPILSVQIIILAAGGVTAFLLKEPFSLTSSSSHTYSSLEVSSVTVKMADSEISVFNVYRRRLFSSHSPALSVFFDEFQSFLVLAATTHEFLITGNFNLHLHNPADSSVSPFLSILSSVLPSIFSSLHTDMVTLSILSSSLLLTPLSIVT